MANDAIQAQLAAIKKAERKVAEAEALWSSAKEAAKDAKEIYEEKVTVLRDTIRQELPLLESA